MYTRVVEATEGFAQLRGSWDDLLARSGVENPYLSHAWLLSWWEAYAGPSDRLNIVCCFQEGPDSLVGILPLRAWSTSGPLSRRALGYLGAAQVGPGCIADPEAAEAVFEEMASYLVSTRDDWDVLSLQNVDAGSVFLERLLAAFEGTASPVLTEISACPAVELPGTWEAYLRTLSHHGRAAVRRYRRYLDSLGTVEVEYVAGAEQLGDALQDVERLFQDSMRRKFGRPFDVSDRYVRLLTASSERLLAAGSLRLLFIKVDGERVAFVHQIRHGNAMFAFQTGFDTAWEASGVGMVAWGHAVEGAIAEGCRAYDFGTGRALYKERWGATGVRSLCDLSLYGRSPVARVAGVRESAMLRAKRILKPLVPASVRARRTREASWRDLQSF